MRIGIMPRCGERNMTGVNKVVQGTCYELLKITKQNELFYIGNTWDMPVKLPEINCIVNSDEINELDYLLSVYPLNVVHSFFPPFDFADKRCGKVLTVHDLRAIVHPEWTMSGLKSCLDGPVRETAKKADVVVAVSEYSKKDIIEYYGISEDKIKVVYNGLYPEDKFSGEGKKIPNDNIIKDNYILSVSAIDLNKNQNGLIESFSVFKEKHKDCDIKLVLVGSIRDNGAINEVMVKYPKAAKDIIFTGYVSEDELVWLYRNAYLFMYPSYFEGFGLPILEAMSVGNAVICSNTTSMPEVGGDAVQYCNPYDLESMVNSIEHVVFNETYRNELKKKAVDQASKFSYEKAAKELMEIYKQFE